MRNVGKEVISKIKSMQSGSKAREFAAAKTKKASPASTAATTATKTTTPEPKPGGKNVAVKTKTSTTPAMQKKGMAKKAIVAVAKKKLPAAKMKKY